MIWVPKAPLVSQVLQELVDNLDNLGNRDQMALQVHLGQLDPKAIQVMLDLQALQALLVLICLQKGVIQGHRVLPVSLVHLVQVDRLELLVVQEVLAQLEVLEVQGQLVLLGQPVQRES